MRAVRARAEVARGTGAFVVQYDFGARCGNRCGLLRGAALSGRALAGALLIFFALVVRQILAHRILEQGQMRM